jgi:hypothetical protein
MLDEGPKQKLSQKIQLDTIFDVSSSASMQFDSSSFIPFLFPFEELYNSSFYMDTNCI